jgi:hypothetical protein
MKYLLGVFLSLAMFFGSSLTFAQQGAPVVSQTTEACHIFKPSSGYLKSASGLIGAAGYIMLIDSATIPSNGAVTPVAWIYAGSAGSWFISYNSGTGAYFFNGIVACASSTGPFTLTQYSTNTVFSGIVQ